MREAGAVADGVEHRRAHVVELGGRDGADGAARLADHELALAAGRVVEARAVAEVDVAHEPDVLEHLEVAIGRGDVAVAGELLGAQRPVGGEERLEQLAARGRDAQAAVAQGGCGGGGSLRLDGRSQA